MAAGSRLPWVLLAAGVALAVAGVAWWIAGHPDEPDPPLDPAEPGVVRVERPSAEDERRYDRALEGFLAAAASADGSGLQYIEAAFAAGPEPEGGGPRPITGAATILWGANGTLRSTLRMESGGSPVALEERYCEPGYRTRLLGAQIVRDRIPPPTQGHHCMADAPMGVMGSLADPTFADGFELRSIDHFDSGNVTARFADDGEGRIAVRFNATGALYGVEYRDPGMVIVARVTHGAPVPLTVPGETRRLPAEAFLAGPTPTGQGWTWTVSGATAPPALSEIEADLVVGEMGEVKASFVLTPGRSQQGGGYGFRFDDRDGDGRLSNDDRFVVTVASNATERPILVLDDLWAQGTVTPALNAPGLEAWAALLALLGAVLARRR